MIKSYPRQLLSDIIENMDDTILHFQTEYEEHYDFLTVPFLDTLDEVVEKTFLNADKSNSEFIKNENKKRKRQKERWYKNVESSCKNLDIQDSNHPFRNLILNYTTSSSEQKKLVYHNIPLSEIIQDKLEKTKEWSNDPKSYLIQFPAFLSLTYNKALNAYKSDLAIFMANYIKEIHHGDPAAMYMDFPNLTISDMPDVPLFGVERSQLDLVEENDDLVEYFNLDENYIFKTIISKSHNNYSMVPVKSLDTQDYEILTAAINYGITPDFYTSGTLYFSLGIAAKVLGGEKPAKHHYKQASDRIKNWTAANYKIISKSSNDPELGGSFNLFDTAFVDQEGISKTVTVICGSVIKECIIKAQVTRINAKDYQSLRNKLTRLISIILQEERIKQAAVADGDNNKTFSFDCTYKYFSHKVRFQEQAWRKNMPNIIKAFDELKEKGIIVEDYSCKNTNIHLSLYTLTDNEREDINFQKVLH